jgi:dUTPase
MFKILDEVCNPTKGSRYSACIDLYAREDITINAGETKIVPLGVKIDLEHIKKENNFWYISEDREKLFDDEEWYYFLDSHYFELNPRSSLPLKTGLIIANGTGIIDIDYEDEIGIILHNPITEHHITWWVDQILNKLGWDKKYNQCNKANQLIKKGDKIAQIKLMKHQNWWIDIASTKDRHGGFGSTDN